MTPETARAVASPVFDAATPPLSSSRISLVRSDAPLTMSSGMAGAREAMEEDAAARVERADDCFG